MNYGYIRVSSREQNEDRQVIALQETGEQFDGGVFTDKQSGKDFERPSYQRMIAQMQEGDVLFVKSIDRLGRNYEEILDQWRILTRDKGVDIVVIDMPLLDTRRDKNLMGRFIADLVLQILSFVSENERQNIKQRQAEGIAAAHARGVKFGRPARELPEHFEEVAAAYQRREITQKAAANTLGMNMSTFRYRANAMGYVRDGVKPLGKIKSCQ